MKRQDAIMFGTRGGVVIDGSEGSVTTGLFKSMQVLDEATITSMAANGVDGISKIVTLPAGDYVFGRGVTSIQISAGVVYLLHA